MSKVVHGLMAEKKFHHGKHKGAPEGTWVPVTVSGLEIPCIFFVWGNAHKSSACQQ